MALGHQEDAQPISATRSKALANISTKACPHGAGPAAYCTTCLGDEERVVGLEDTIVELKARLEEQANLIDNLTNRQDYTKEDVNAIGNAVQRLEQLAGGGILRRGGPGGGE
jgi:hypothetical protein